MQKSQRPAHVELVSRSTAIAEKNPNRLGLIHIFHHASQG
jgi:hypothetical protein